MDRPNFDAPANNTTKAEELGPKNHSGNLSPEMRETPVREFRDTSLEEATTLPEFKSKLPTGEVVTVASFTGQSPETVEVISDVPPTTPPIVTAEQGSPKPERKRLGLGAKIGAGLAGLALAGGAALGITSAVNAGNNTPPEDDPKGNGQVEEEPGTGEEKPPVVEEEKTIEQLINETKIEAGLSAEEYAETLQNRLNDWALAGATDNAFNDWSDSDSKDAFEDQLAAAETTVYTNALFGPGYQNEPSLVNAEANLTARNAAWLASWMRSYDYEKDTGTLKIDSAIEQAEVLSENPETGERVIYIAGYDTNNAEEARFTSEDNRAIALSSNGQSWDHTLTVKDIEGVTYITKWED